MKKTAIFLASFGLPIAALQAQTVPLFINYQGKVTGGAGVPLGSTGTAPNFTAAPENRKIIFRVFDTAAAGTGNRLWSEEQTVTISLGEFSVLLGQGTAAVYNGVQEGRPALETVFTGGGAVTPAGPLRFLEIVVDNGDGTFTPADSPIAPRQRLTTTAYSFRASVADKVQNLAITADSLASGSVSNVKIANSAITTEKIANGGISNANLADNSINAAKIADGSVGTADLANGSVTAAKLDAGIGVWTASGTNVYRPGGSVGVGKQPAGGIELDVNGDIASSGNITASGAITATGALTGSSITTTGPFGATNISANGFVRARGGIPGGGGGNNNGFSFNSPGDNDSGMFSSTDGQLEFYTNASERIRITPDGNVGIGTNLPRARLDVIGLAASTSMTDNGFDSEAFSKPTGANTWISSGVMGSGVQRGPELYGLSGPDGLPNGATAIAQLGIRADGWIASARGLIVYSDRRIKRDLHVSDTESDLQAIQKLRVTDYRMVDPSADGKDWHKGFIAQEVEKVIPRAVKRSVEFVPDIFSQATATVFDPATKTLAITLPKDHGLKAGDLVRLHMDGRRHDLKVSVAACSTGFVVENCGSAPEKVLVYGRQVNDFRTVDYDRIFTTSVSALQELKKEKDEEVNALRAENASLQRRLAALEANDKARDAKLAVIENLLISAGKSASRTVSLKAGE